MPTLITVLALVKKNKAVVPSEVAEHEVAVLRAIHGDQNVSVPKESRDYGTIEVPDSAELEMERLRTRYRTAQDDPVARAYPTLDALAQRAGLSISSDDVEFEVPQVKASESVDMGEEKRKAQVAAARAKKKADAEAKKPAAPAPAPAAAKPPAAPAGRQAAPAK